MTTRSLAAAFFLVSASVTGAFAQGQIPVEQDLRRFDRIERRIEERGGPPASVPEGAGVNPSGVVGFDGPPGTVGDSVNSYGALPQGITGSDIR